MTDPRDIQIEGLRALLAEIKAERDTALHNCSRWRAEAHREREARIKLEYRLRQYEGTEEDEEESSPDETIVDRN